MQDTELALLVDSFMRNIHFGLQQHAPDFDRKAVGPGGGIVLMTLAEMGETPLNELTKRVARDKSQMTRTVRSLETKGLLLRKTSSLDGRVTLISLTPEGEKVVAELMQTVAKVVSEILSPISDDEKKALKAMLSKALR